jgi:hypothetical protein
MLIAARQRMNANDPYLELLERDLAQPLLPATVLNRERDLFLAEHSNELGRSVRNLSMAESHQKPKVENETARKIIFILS